MDNFLIVDTETTGLDEAEIVQIAIIDLKGQTLLNSLVKPSIPIPAKASEIHGVTDELVASAPRFHEIYPKIKQILSNKQIINYNANFDAKILNYCCDLYKLPKFKLAKKNSLCNG